MHHCVNTYKQICMDYISDGTYKNIIGISCQKRQFFKTHAVGISAIEAGYHDYR